MIITNLRSLPAAVAAAAIALAPVASNAAETCFTAFGGTVHYQFTAKPAAFTGTGTTAIPGVVFGSLSSCANLTHWGIVGTAVGNGSVTVLGLRAETADAANCGAVDYTVQLKTDSLSGPMQLYNDRNSFGNTGTFVKAPCVAVPAGVSPSAVRGRDLSGNGAS